MAHNFPKNEKIKYFSLAKTETEKQLKEILKLAIDNDVNFNMETISNRNGDYPYLCFKISNSYCLCRLRQNMDNDTLILTFEQFKQFIQGKGDVKSLVVPFLLKLKLNFDYTAEITKQGVKVGCQSFTHEKVKELYLASQKALKS